MKSEKIWISFFNTSTQNHEKVILFTQTNYSSRQYNIIGLEFQGRFTGFVPNIKKNQEESQKTPVPEKLTVFWKILFFVKAIPTSEKFANFWRIWFFEMMVNCEK